MDLPIEKILVNLETIIFISVVLMNLVKKNSHLVGLYVAESLALVGMLTLDGILRSSWELIFVAIIVFLVKVIFAPYFFYRFLSRSKLNLLTSTYLNIPTTLVVIVAIVFFTNSDILEPLNSFIYSKTSFPMMLLGSVFISIFILINRKGSLSQIIGILSVENAIAAFGILIGFTQGFAIEAGIVFNILVWIVLAIIFLELIYRKLGTVDVTKLNKLKK